MPVKRFFNGLLRLSAGTMALNDHYANSSWDYADIIPFYRGDLNCSGEVDLADINPFVLYLSNYAQWETMFPGCYGKTGDTNGDGAYPSFGDINPFVALLSGGA